MLNFFTIDNKQINTSELKYQKQQEDHLVPLYSPKNSKLAAGKRKFYPNYSTSHSYGDKDQIRSLSDLYCKKFLLVEKVLNCRYAYPRSTHTLTALPKKEMSSWDFVLKEVVMQHWEMMQEMKSGRARAMVIARKAKKVVKEKQVKRSELHLIGKMIAYEQANMVNTLWKETGNQKQNGVMEYIKNSKEFFFTEVTMEQEESNNVDAAKKLWKIVARWPKNKGRLSNGEEISVTPKRKKETKSNAKMNQSIMQPIERNDDLANSVKALRQYENTEEALYVFYDDQMLIDDNAYSKAFVSSIENIYKFPNCVMNIKSCSAFEQLSWLLEKKEQVQQVVFDEEFEEQMREYEIKPTMEQTLETFIQSNQKNKIAGHHLVLPATYFQLCEPFEKFTDGTGNQINSSILEQKNLKKFKDVIKHMNVNGSTFPGTMLYTKENFLIKEDLYITKSEMKQDWPFYMYFLLDQQDYYFSYVILSYFNQFGNQWNLASDFLQTHLISQGFHIDSQICEEKWVNLQSKKLCRLVSKDNRILPNREFTKQLQNNQFSLQIPQVQTSSLRNAMDMYDYKKRERTMSQCYEAYYKMYKQRFENQTVSDQGQDGKNFFLVQQTIKLYIEGNKNKMQANGKDKVTNWNLSMQQIKEEDEDNETKQQLGIDLNKDEQEQQLMIQCENKWKGIQLEEAAWAEKATKDVSKEIELKTKRYQASMLAQSRRKKSKLFLIIILFEKVINDKNCPLIAYILQQNSQQPQQRVDQIIPTVPPASAQQSRQLQKLPQYYRPPQEISQVKPAPDTLNLQHQLSQPGQQPGQPINYNIPAIDQQGVQMGQAQPSQAMIHNKLINQMQQKFPQQMSKQQMMMLNQQQRQQQGLPLPMNQQQMIGNQQMYYQKMPQPPQTNDQPAHYQQNVMMQQQQPQQQIIQSQMIQQNVQGAPVTGRGQNIQNSYIMNGINHGISNRANQAQRQGSNKKGHETKKKKKEKD